MRLRTFALAAGSALALAAAATAAMAGQGVYTITGAWNGTFNGTAFTNTGFTVVASGDTSLITTDAFGDEFLMLQSSIVTLDGFGTFTMSEPTKIATNVNDGETTFDHFDPSLRNVFLMSLATPVDLKHSFSAVSSTFTEVIPDPLPTSGGVLQFDIAEGADPALSISGVVRDVGVPEPAVWALMLCGFGGAGAMLRRRRALAA